MLKRILPVALLAALLAAELTGAQVAVASPADVVAHSEVVALLRSKTGTRSFSTAPKPVITGQMSVGAVLHVSTGRWKPTPSFTYRWRVDGYTIPGATQSRYTIRATDAGSRITVVVRATKRGYRAAERSSAARQVIVPASAAPAPAPTTSAPAPIASAPAPVNPSPISTVPIPVTPVNAPPVPGDGDYRIGVTLSPGTYVTAASTSGCYWERVTSFDGSFSSIVENDFGTGQRILTVSPSDYGVHFAGCGAWVRASSAPVPASVGTGQYLVGAQVSPGLWQATPSASGCYWALLNGFGGGLDAIIDNDLIGRAGTVYVQIGSNAAGFESSNCGTWTRISS